jgi:MFS superfamily sulfate permease-like transporter
LLFDPIVITGAIVIALVASAETLLCATAVDQLHTGERTNYDKELTAQGIGNVLCGLIGALPMTGVIVRSSANVNSGAKTRLSSILHGGWLLLFVAALPFVLAYIPRAALGALLVHIGIKLVNLKQIKELWKTSKSEVAIYAVTLTVIVCEDLLVGVVVGIMLSAAKLLYRFSHLEMDLQTENGLTRLQMHGAATFLRLPSLAQKLDEVPESAELHVDFEHLSYIDHACLDLLMNWAKQHEQTGGKLVLDWESLHGRFSADPSVEAKVAMAKTAPIPLPVSQVPTEVPQMSA